MVALIYPYSFSTLVNLIRERLISLNSDSSMNHISLSHCYIISVWCGKSPMVWFSNFCYQNLVLPGRRNALNYNCWQSLLVQSPLLLHGPCFGQYHASSDSVEILRITTFFGWGMLYHNFYKWSQVCQQGHRSTLVLFKVTHCAEHVSANTRPHQLCWQEISLDYILWLRGAVPQHLLTVADVPTINIAALILLYCIFIKEWMKIVLHC